MSLGTSVYIIDLIDFIRSDGSVIFTSDQSLGGNRLTNVAPAINPTDAINMSQVPSDFPVGSIVISVVNNIPPKYLECNGQAKYRTSYSQLYSKIGVKYGRGNGSTTFNLPDYRNLLLRGQANGRWIDPNRNTRTNRGDGVTGDRVGTKQGAEMGSHNHGQFQIPTGGGSHSHSWEGFGSFQRNGGIYIIYGNAGGGASAQLSYNGNHNHSVWCNSTGSGSTTCKQKMVKFLIKYEI